MTKWKFLTTKDKSVENEPVTKPGIEEARKAIRFLENFFFFKIWRDDDEILERNKL